MAKYSHKIDLLSVIAISLSSMLGSGIFVLPGLAYALTGPSLWLAYVLAGIAIIPSALSKSELASAMPSNGGTYVYLERTFGPFLGTLSGIGLWLSLLLKSSFALVGLSAYLSIFWNVQIKYAAISILTLILILNIFGVGKISKLIKIIVLITISSIAVIIAATLNSNVEVINSDPFLLKGMDGLMSAVAFVFISYAGVTKVAAIADDIENPSKNIPRGIITSLLIATTLYTSLSYCLPLIIPGNELNNNLRSFYDLAIYLFNIPVATIFGIIAIVTMSSMANAGIMAASRFPYAMSVDHLLPSLFSKISTKYHTPYNSLIITALASSIFILFLPIDKTAKLASGFLIFIYALEHIALIILRELRVQWYEPDYKTPFYPLPQIIGIITCFYLLWEMGILMLYGIIGVSLPGILLFVFYNRFRVSRKGVIGIRGVRSDLVENTKSDFEIKSNQIKNTRTSNSDVCVILLNNELSPEYLCEFALILSKSNQVDVNYISEVPEGNQLYCLDEDPTQKSINRRLKAMSKSIEKNILVEHIITHDLVGTLYHISNDKLNKWIVIEGAYKKQGLLTFYNPFGWLKKRLATNLAIYQNNGIRYIKSILIYYRKNDHFNFLIQTSMYLADYYKAGVTLVTIDDELSTKENLTSFLGTEKIENIKILNINSISSPKEHLVNITVEYDLLIIESCAVDFLHSFRSEESYIMKKAACSVLAIRSDVNEI